MVDNKSDKIGEATITGALQQFPTYRVCFAYFLFCNNEYNIIVSRRRHRQTICTSDGWKNIVHVNDSADYYCPMGRYKELQEK